MKRNIFILLLLLTVSIFAGCAAEDSGADTLGGNLYSAETTTESVPVTEKASTVLYDDRVDDSIMLTGYSVLPTLKYSLVKKWLEDEENSEQKILALCLAENNENEDVLVLTADDSGEGHLLIYRPLSDSFEETVMLSDDKTIWEIGAGGNEYLADYINRAVVGPYIEGGNLKESTQNELDAEFSEKPKSGEFGLAAAYENFFVLFGTDSERAFFLYYNYELEPLGKEIQYFGKSEPCERYEDSLSPLREKYS